MAIRFFPSRLNSRILRAIVPEAVANFGNEF
jgi:hypothetical protein